MEDYRVSRFENFMDGLKEFLIAIFVFTILLGGDIIYEVIFQKVWDSPTISLRGFIIDKLGLANSIPNFSDGLKTFFIILTAIEIIAYLSIKIYEFIRNRKNR